MTAVKVEGEEGRDTAGILIELQPKSFAEELFFGTDTNAIAAKKYDDGGEQSPPRGVSQAGGGHQTKHSEIDRIPHHSVRSLRNQFVSLNDASLVGPLLSERAHSLKAEKATCVGKDNGGSGQDQLAKR